MKNYVGNSTIARSALPGLMLYVYKIKMPRYCGHNVYILINT